MKTSSKSGLGLATLTAAGFLGTPSAHAQVTGFVSNPTTNSADFRSAVVAKGDTVDSNVNFNAMTVGPVEAGGPTFYKASDGLTFSSTGLTTAIQNGVGPGQENTFNGPFSAGEGVHAASHYLLLDGIGSLTLSFSAPVAGVGFSTIDLYNPGGANALSITAYSGTGGTGTALGTFNAVGDNFQTNNIYFMGAADRAGANTIGSLVLAMPNGSHDDIGIDDIQIARAAAPVPEASTTASFGLLLVLGLGGLVVAAKRRKAPAA